jgi:DNA-binding response OmpR family regulator
MEREPEPENKGKSMILAVDDEPDILKIIKGIIQHAGFSVYCFTSPVLALEHFRLNSENYHTILLDIRMPGINGFQFAKKAKK